MNKSACLTNFRFLFRRLSTEKDFSPLGQFVAWQLILPTVHRGRYPRTTSRSTTVVWFQRVHSSFLRHAWYVFESDEREYNVEPFS